MSKNNTPDGMMKHIKRKTVMYGEISEEQMLKLAPQKASDDLLREIKFSTVKGKQAIQLMESGEILRSFFYDNNGMACTIPLANPVLVYFNLAQLHLRDIIKARTSLLSLFSKKEKEVNEDTLSLFYQYFGLTSSFVVMLMTALEAFVNQKLDQSKNYERNDNGKCTRVYNFEQIQRWIPLNEKIEAILNRQQSKDFSKAHPIAQQHFENLKGLRDLIVHTKMGKHYESYIELYRKTLNFSFNDSIEAVKGFINYFEPNLIEPCPCSQAI